MAIFYTPALLYTPPVILRSIQLRNPYVDPLNLILFVLLAAYRELAGDDPARDDAARLLAGSIAGVAAALRNTG
jgi:phosphoenolpyruvate carboxylase